MKPSFTYLHEINEDVELWGAKAVGLLQLIKNGFNVPHGFVIPTSFYQAYKDNLMDREKLELLFWSFLEEAHLYDKEIILRSSANIEGDNQYACCGVYRSTILDRSKSVFYNLKKIWDSVESPEAIAYCNYTSLKCETVKMAVIVQEIKIGTASGIIQTSDVINCNENFVVVEIEEGSLDAVVSGHQNAIMLVLEKEREIVCDMLPPFAQISQIRQGVLDAQNIERFLGYPVELEVQFASNSNYYIQVRKLT